MVTNVEKEWIIKALSRSAIRRDLLGCPGSDADLLQLIVGADADKKNVECLASFSRMLRLMDALVNGIESGEGFVDKFSALWLSLRAVYADDLGLQLQRLAHFYGDIQLFCASEQECLKEPLLFGRERLHSLTETAYHDLLQWWLDRLTSQSCQLG